MVSEVLSTYSSSSSPASGGSIDRPMGDMAGHALGLGDGIGFKQSFDEHGIILGLARVIPKTSYTQGLNKFWQKFDKFDHYFPQFANLGEQEVYNKELFVKGDTSVDNQIFGYQQRYAEYKYSHNRIAGDFRDNLAFGNYQEDLQIPLYLTNHLLNVIPMIVYLQLQNQMKTSYGFHYITM